MKQFPLFISPSVLFAFASLAILTGTASATTIANLATGQDGSGNIQTTSGASDANWTQSVTSGAAQVVISSSADWYGGWLADDTTSAWIAPNAGITNNGPAPYTFTDTFNTSGYQLSSLAISGGMWAIDDGGTVSLNGNLLSTVGSGAWGGLTAFSVPNSDFVSGVNTLTITLTDSDEFLEAVRLEGTVTGTAVVTGTPEPATVLLSAAGLAALAFRRKARR